MTRFARAKGSKSSNSRTPEDSTDWVEMKSDLQKNSSHKKSKRDEDVDLESPPVKSKKMKSSNEPQWAEFDTSNGETSFEVDNNIPAKKRKKETVTEIESSNDMGSSGSKKKKSKKRKEQNAEKKSSIDGGDQVVDTTDEVNSGSNAKAFKKGLKKKQKKPREEKSTLKINGVYIDVVKYDGFFVKADDAERLKDLRKKLIKESIPQEEVVKIMKLERRKAEKALSKEKKKVCFQCRKPGHQLADCPQSKNRVGTAVGDDEGATGLCYKCGSTEHTHFECKVQKDGVYRFAKCFICHEQGHISNQCPDNPKGLYPRGGGCNICGDVTHMKKDCPQLAKVREENVLTLGTFGSGSAVEDNGESFSKTATKPKVSKKKVIKF